MPSPDAWDIGIDVLNLGRFRAFLVRNEGLLEEVFTQAELSAAACDGRRELYLATRWALKEAVLKALGAGWGGDIEWTDVEAVGGLFAPRIALHGSAKQVAERSGARRAVGSASGSGDAVIALAAVTPAGQSPCP